jgi:type IV pilus assembly protein PilA
MFCPKCGAVSDGDVCTRCGTAHAVGAAEFPAAHVVATRTSGMAIAGFVCAFVCGVLGLVFSVIGRNECKRSGGTIKGEGLATAGMVISIITIVLSVVGVLAAIAIPAFVDYMHKTKTTEAQLELRHIGNAAKDYLIVHDAFPVGTAPLTPATPCCMGPGAKCETNPADWMTPEWRALDFQISEPHRYQYSYTSDGHSFRALAVGDLDCDTVMVTYTLDIDTSGRTRLSGPSNPD